MANVSIYEVIKKGVKGVLQPKIKVERIQANGRVKRLKKYPIKEGKVIIKAGGMGRGDLKYEPPLESERIAQRGWWIFKTKMVYYQDGADRLNPLTPDGDPPKYTAEFLKKMSEGKVLSQQAKVGATMTPIQWITLFVTLASAFMLYLMMVDLGIINVG